ncbi:DNA repair protein RecN [Oscillatoria amoena NRMC-F 0135]|nr:DNA repair protein RecN [Oscillatoria amoena NRMC-F 0135]
MLLAIRIENFALIDRLELEFGAGLNVLTGETGAGKSILLEAIDAALGGKLNSRAMRTGADRAVVEATFALNEAVMQWLQEQEIDLLDESVVVCSREMVMGQGTFRSRSRVNGILVNRQGMDRLRESLVEITAQGQTVQLGQPALQREWLDLYGGREVLEQRGRVAAAYEEAQRALQALEHRRSSEQHRLQRIDLLEYQVGELQTASLTTPDELEQLEQESQRLAHSVELQQNSYQIYQTLYQSDAGENAVADLLGKAESLLNDMLEYDAELQPILELVAEALAQVEEASRQINAYGDRLETDPSRLEDVETRIQDLKQICRKYGPTLADAIAYSQKIQTELAELTGSEQTLEALEQAHEQATTHLMRVCAQLTDLRTAAANQLEARLLEELRPLAMDKVQFKVGILPASPTGSGADRIAFLFSPNPGEPLQPLASTASGGEMSRFLLALKACFSQVDPASTLVFDEIDAGVSGRVAGAIALKLHQLGLGHQVLCVTHQPIVAAMAEHHFRVSKEVIAHLEQISNGQHSQLRTVVRVTPLEGRQRQEELAQLTGGESAQSAIAFVESLLVQAAELRQKNTL